MVKPDLLLRPRASMSATPTREIVQLRRRRDASPPHVPLLNKRFWVSRLLLVAVLLNLVVILAWSSQNITGERAEGDFTIVKSNIAGAPQQEVRTNFRATHKDLELEFSKQQAQKKPNKIEEQTKEQLNFTVSTISTQAVVDARLRTERDAVVAKMESKGLVSSTYASSNSQMMDMDGKYQEAEQQARDSLLLSKNEATPRNLKCLGWRATDGCSPYGPRKPDKDISCTRMIPNGLSGYCEVEDTATGARFRVMRHYCNSSNRDTRIRCSDAQDFVNFHHKARAAIDDVLPNVGVTHEQSQRDGIVMVVYPKLVPSAYATIKTLRQVLGCRLPIECWYRQVEFNEDPDAMKPLTALAVDNETSVISFHEITDGHASGYSTKVYAIYNSYLERILFLDADNVPSRDPTYLFSSPEFLDNGAVFWPDFWHPKHTIFNIHNQSLLWELIDTPFVDMFEQESGQILIDRRRHAQALELVKFYSFYRPSFFDNMKLVHGDKDLFRLSWLKLGAPFHMIKTPPAIAGKIINGSFCGLTMVQHDAKGDVVFLHRNSHKLMGEPLRDEISYKSRAVALARKKTEIRQNFRREGKEIPTWFEIDAIARADETPPSTLEPPEPDGYPDSVVWTHMLSFSNASKQEDYYVEIYSAEPEFPKSQNCYGQRNVSKSKHFYTQEVFDLPIAGLEMNLRRFAAEAMAMKQANRLTNR